MVTAIAKPTTVHGISRDVTSETGTSRNAQPRSRRSTNATVPTKSSSESTWVVSTSGYA